MGITIIQVFAAPTAVFVSIGLFQGVFLRDENIRKAFDHFDFEGKGYICAEDLMQVRPLQSTKRGVGVSGFGVLPAGSSGSEPLLKKQT